MRKGIRNGGGGEYPENDVEALLGAEKHRSEYAHAHQGTIQHHSLPEEHEQCDPDQTH